jgi:tripartite-type tricarboxylate transporter receptor subunit TctC
LGGAMQTARLVAKIALICLAAFGAGAARGQEFPSKPIRLVTSGIGGGIDFAARLIAAGLTEGLGQQVIVDNRPGAGGAIAAQAVTSAPRDGYTLLFYSGTMWTLPLLRNDVHYDPIKGFSPITLAARAPMILVAHPSLPVKSVGQLIALAKARPGELNCASGAPGSATHLAPELFKAMAGVRIVTIPYKTGAARMAALVSGEVQLQFAPSGEVAAHIKSGRVRPLAVTSSHPSALLPGLPAIAATGVPGYESVLIYGMWAPAGTSASIINRLNRETARVVNRPDVKEKFFNAGVETVGSTPEELASAMKSDMARIGKVIKEAGIRAD